MLVIINQWVFTSPSLYEECEEAIEQSNRLICTINLEELAIACKTYAHDHDSVFPDTIQTLLDSDYITRQTLVCPNLDEQVANINDSYVYIPGQINDSYYKNILAYEKPNNHNGEGGTVVYIDGNAEFVTPYSEVEKLVKETRQRLPGVKD